MKLFIFGATGTIGKATLSVAADLGIDVVGLGARSNCQKLLEAAQVCGAEILHIADEAAAEALRRTTKKAQILTGPPEEAITAAGADTVVNAVSGAAGLAFSLAAIRTSVQRLALANKESLVMAGELIMDEARRRKTDILPIDSEHASLFLLLSKFNPEDVEEIIITASGGPFLRRKNLENITPKEALAHPVWNMGKRISVDSATMLNKVFEVVEAHILFGVEYERIKVLVHPEGVVHGGVRLRDGTVVLHSAAADMRFAIQQALCYPDIGRASYGAFKLGGTLHFEEPNVERFFALEALKDLRDGAGVGYRVALNAADEVAVAAFLNGHLPFSAIARVAVSLARRFSNASVTSPQQALRLDKTVREQAFSEVEKWSR